MSQPAREFIVKIIELSLWSSDFLIGHFLLFMISPPLLIPYFDRLHATMLCKCFLSYFVTSSLTHRLVSLVASIKTDPRTTLLDEAKEAAQEYCMWLFINLPERHRSIFFRRSSSTVLYTSLHWLVSLL